jgi:hypothetical protein
MLQRALTLSRYVVFVAVIAALAASVALIVYEAAVVAEVIFEAVKQGGFQLKSGRALAVGLIEAIDVFSDRYRRAGHRARSAPVIRRRNNAAAALA